MRWRASTIFVSGVLSGLPLALAFSACGAKSELARPPRPDADLDAFAVPDANLDAGRDAPIPDGCTPRGETCDGVDQDCDGVADDGITCWTLDGAPIEPITSTVCGNVWYSYDSPAMASANPPVPGILVPERATIAVVETGRACGGGTIAVIADQVDDGSGGSLRARFAFERDDGGILGGDEPDECAYERGALRGACVWGWQPCCTDGVMLGPFPGDQCVELTVDGHDGRSPVGIDSVVLVDGRGDVRALALGAPLRLCRRAVPAR